MMNQKRKGSILFLETKKTAHRTALLIVASKSLLPVRSRISSLFIQIQEKEFKSLKLTCLSTTAKDKQHCIRHWLQSLPGHTRN